MCISNKEIQPKKIIKLSYLSLFHETDIYVQVHVKYNENKKKIVVKKLVSSDLLIRFDKEKHLLFLFNWLIYKCLFSICTIIGD